MKILKPTTYVDIDTKINEQNEILMNLQRQKVWNNSQNAKLELEVEALQRQLAAFDKLEREEEANSTSIAPYGKVPLNARKIEQGIDSYSNNKWLPIGESRQIIAFVQFQKCRTLMYYHCYFRINFHTLKSILFYSDYMIYKVDEEVQSSAWNVSEGNDAEPERLGRRPRQTSVEKGLREEMNSIGADKRDKESKYRELTDAKETEGEKLNLRPRLGRRGSRNTNGRTTTTLNVEIDEAYQYNFDREKPIHRALIVQDVHKNKKRAAKSIRRRTEESSQATSDAKKKREVDQIF